MKNNDEENTDILLGKIWQTSRKAKGFTQEYVAEQLNLGPRYVSDLERDKTNGSLRTLIKLCNLYQITPTYVLQKYLNITDDLKIDPDLIGYYSLSKHDKEIIIKMIEFMNTDYRENNTHL